LIPLNNSKSTAVWQAASRENYHVSFTGIINRKEINLWMSFLFIEDTLEFKYFPIIIAPTFAIE